MKRLYEKNQVRHFLVWLALYLMATIVAVNLGVNVGISAHAAAVIPLGVLTVIMLAYLLRSGIGLQIGLGVSPAVPAARMWFYLPLLILIGLPLLRGVRDDLTILIGVTIIAHFVFVGFLEEVLFRGLLLHALLRKGRPVWAVIVTSLTFGLGHSASLFIGQGGTDTALQIINATLVGLLFTLVVIATGSLQAVIVAHILYNIIAEFSTIGEGTSLIIPAIAVLIIYGSWLLYGAGALSRLKEIAATQRPPDSAQQASRPLHPRSSTLSQRSDVADVPERFLPGHPGPAEPLTRPREEKQ
ncbi:CAAX amino terminal protease self- immunity (plasmid) [Corynebacterium occultum]|uniref:CAAX amino terminal protease self-immunity n=1 Tax=Corynebacterium occultum TaxID=2675219 RepID=A0A6B8VXA7_9CORY|nr:CPBP family intramembrane glutamic endopeptidase [Corynebacterium occultum]QGU08763.1 CAAX amino terminal protease self- immunity [Corynebacterium occultum]